MIIQVRTLITQLKTSLLYLLLFISNHAGCSKASVYGSNCDTPCPENCKDSTCHIQSGSCFNCKPGWSRMYCNTSKMICIPRNNLTIRYFFYMWFSYNYVCRLISYFLNVINDINYLNRMQGRMVWCQL